jgi:hypothetical protein
MSFPESTPENDRALATGSGKPVEIRADRPGTCAEKSGIPSSPTTPGRVPPEIAGGEGGAQVQVAWGECCELVEASVDALGSRRLVAREAVGEGVQIAAGSRAGDVGDEGIEGFPGARPT